MLILEVHRSQLFHLPSVDFVTMSVVRHLPLLLDPLQLSQLFVQVESFLLGHLVLTVHHTLVIAASGVFRFLVFGSLKVAHHIVISVFDYLV